MRVAPIIALAVLTASCGDPAPLVTVTETRVMALPSSAAAYFTLTNSGGVDHLLSIDAPGTGRVTLHETAMDGGIMRMRPINGAIAVEAGARLTFSPYGKHAMIALDRPIDPKSPVTLRFNFERQGPITVEALVSPPTSEAQ